MFQGINLRASHFALGNNQNVQMTSEYSRKFVQDAKQAEQNSGKQNIAQINTSDQLKAVQSAKANLRASHIRLGDHQQFYNTSNNVLLKYDKNYESAKLSEEQRKDLRNHHFKLGQYAPTTQTVYNIQYDEKKVNLDQISEQQKQKMRGHHHDFKEQNNIIISSKYNDDYNKQIDPSSLTQSIPNDKLKQKVVELRHSHIVLGKEQLPFTTIAQKDYQKKNGDQLSFKQMNFQQTHFDLGIQKDEMCSTNDIFHSQQPLVENKLAESTKNDLISSHFKLGADFEVEQYSSEQSANFKWPGKMPSSKATQSTIQLQKNYFKLGIDPQCYQTSYSSTMKAPQLEITKQGRNQLQDRGSNFQLGKQGNNFMSEAASRFQSNPNQKPATINADLKHNLRQSHFQFQDVAQNTYQTLQKTSFSAKDLSLARREGAQKLGDNQRQNFNFGQMTPNYQSTYAKFYQQHQLDPSKFNYHLKADLTRNHFKLG